MSIDPVIEVMNLNKSFGSNHVLRDFTASLYRNENLVVLGKSGSGKSVLVKCIIGLLEPDSGTIRVFNQDISDYNREDLDKMRMKVGFLFQSNALYDSMTVRENLEFPLRRHRLKKNQGKSEVNDLVMEALSNVGLAHTVDMMPSELSGGMRKRIALARTLILRPRIILYDEPTTGLDPITGKEISKLILDVQQKYSASSIIISHDMNCISIASNRVVILIDGKCYADGSYNDLSEECDPVIHEYFEQP